MSKMAGHRRLPRRSLTVVKAKSVQPVDFRDAESQRVLTAAACAVAHELGREAAREYFAELVRRPKVR